MKPAGSINGYLCGHCGGYTVTIHEDEGVTPMFLACRADGTEDFKCGAKHPAQSSMYLGLPPEAGPPKWAWYSPGSSEFDTLDPSEQHHVENGGLLLRYMTRDERKRVSAVKDMVKIAVSNTSRVEAM